MQQQLEKCKPTLTSTLLRPFASCTTTVSHWQALCEQRSDVLSKGACPSCIVSDCNQITEGKRHAGPTRRSVAVCPTRHLTART